MTPFMVSAKRLPDVKIGIKHPAPTKRAIGRRDKGLVADGKFASSRVMELLKKMEGDAGTKEGMSVAELSAALNVRPSEAEQMGMSCWRGGLVMFDIVEEDIIFRMIPQDN